jgi:hypothetical protein
MLFGHCEKVATWICSDREDDLPFYGITGIPNPTSGYLKKGPTSELGKKVRLQTPIVSREKSQGLRNEYPVQNPVDDFQ